MNSRAASVSGRTFAALKVHNYRLYFFSQLVSMSGSWMQTIAQAWLVLELTGSGTALGTVVAMQFLPVLLFGPMGGVIADRVDKRKLIIVTQLMAGMLALTLAILTISGVVELWMVYAIAAGSGLVMAIDNPTRQTFVMEMVGPEYITNAITLNSVVVNGARIIGPAVAGVLIATIGIGPCFMFNAMSYVAVIVALVLIRVDRLHPPQRTARARGQLREGLKYAWRTPNLRTTLVMLAIIGTLTYEFTITLPLLSEDRFGTGSSGLAVMTALMGLGAVVGGLITAWAGNPTPRRFLLVALGFGAIVVGVSLMPTIVLVCVLMPFLGAASITVISLSNAMLQLNSAPELRGRVMALFSVALIGSTPIGGPIIGYIAEHVSPQAAIMIGGVAAIGAAIYGWTRLEPTTAVAVGRSVALQDSVGTAE